MNDEIQKIWDKRKKKCYICPNCRMDWLILNRSFGRFFFRYWVECRTCHWCGPNGNTVGGAVWRWNRYAMRTKRKVYE